MTWFLCLSVPQEVVPKLGHSFNAKVFITDASDYPIGKATRGKNKNWAVYFLQTSYGSWSLVGRAGVKVKRTHNNDHTELLELGIRALLEDEACLSVSVLLHWMHGFIDKEEITIKRWENVDLSEIDETIVAMEEDVLYTITP